MKKLVILSLLGLFLTTGANAASIINTCTSTYQLYGYDEIQLSGWDTAAVTLDTQPIITVVKYAKNIRTGIEDNNSVNALIGDTIEFRITWANEGGATADTVSLTDYLPAGLTYITGSVTHTESNCDTSALTITDVGGNILFKVNAASGSNPGPIGSGEIKFRATVNE